MNQHLATYPTKDGIQMLWLTATPSLMDENAYHATGLELPNASKLEMDFRRTSMGISFDPLFVTVVGERVFEHEDTLETVYIVLDEALDTDILTDTLNKVIELKDKYSVRNVYCPNEPEMTLRTLRGMDGLCRYPEPQIKPIAKGRWPSFVDFDTVAAVIPRELPGLDSQAAQLNSILSDIAQDPRSGSDMVGADSQPVPRILFLDDFPTYRTMHSMRSNSPGGTTALWLAIMGMETTGVRPKYVDDRFEPSTRNPTGY